MRNTAENTALLPDTPHLQYHPDLNRNIADSEPMTTEQDLLKRITARPDVFGGKPIIRDMRISVGLILSLRPKASRKKPSLMTIPTFRRRTFVPATRMRV